MQLLTISTQVAAKSAAIRDGRWYLTYSPRKDKFNDYMSLGLPEQYAEFLTSLEVACAMDRRRGHMMPWSK